MEWIGYMLRLKPDASINSYINMKIMKKIMILRNSRRLHLIRILHILFKLFNRCYLLQKTIVLKFWTVFFPNIRTNLFFGTITSRVKIEAFVASSDT